MRTILTTILVCSLSLQVLATEKLGETRTAKVTVDIAPSDVINIKAKYTELLIESWDKNEVEVTATVRYDGKITNKIQSFLDDFEGRVKNQIQSRINELTIDSDLDLPNKVQIGGKHVGIQISYGDDELKIMYEIKAPGGNEYIINNSYEDVKLIGSFEDITMKQYSGDLQAERINKADLNLKYGSASIEEIGIAEMEIYEQDLNIGQIKELEINCKYSELELRKVGTMDATSYESDFDMDEVSMASGNYKYGQMEITERLDEGEFEFYEMDLETKTAGSIRFIDSKYSNFTGGKIESLRYEQSYEDETQVDWIEVFDSRNSKYGNHEIDILNGRWILNGYEDDVDIDRLGSNAEEIRLSGKYIESTFGIQGSSFILTSDVKYGKVEYDENTVEVRRYIKESDQLEVEVHSKSKDGKIVQIIVKGYEMDLVLDD